MMTSDAGGLLLRGEGNIPGLNADVQRAREELEKHSTSIRLVPDLQAGKPHYVAGGSNGV